MADGSLAKSAAAFVRSSHEAANSVATEVWQSLRGSAECVLCPSEQPSHDVPVGDVEDIGYETLVSVETSRSRRVAASNREQDFALYQRRT